MKKRLLHILIAIDQLFWVLLTLGKGYPDETISCACYRMEKQGKFFGIIARPFIDKLFFWDKQHCRKAYLSEVFRTQLPKTFIDPS